MATFLDVLTEVIDPNFAENKIKELENEISKQGEPLPQELEAIKLWVKQQKEKKMQQAELNKKVD